MYTLKKLVRRVWKKTNVRTSDRPGQKDADWYDRSLDWAENFHKHYTCVHYYAFWTVLADRMLRDRVNRILDVGCGTGQFASMLRDKGFTDYCGIDFSQRRIELARRACPQFRFVVANALETDLFQTDPYDAVVSTEFLEHVESDLEILQRIRAGTRFYGSVPDFPSASHVRHFKDGDDVYKRYSHLFTEFRVDFVIRNEKGRKFFLIQGIKL